MNIKNIFLIAFLLTVFLPAGLSAKEYSFIYKGIRPMGMGGAFVAVSNDANALFYNPAGLADISESRTSLLNLGAEVGKSAYSLFREARTVDFDNELETAEFLRDNIGEYCHTSVTFLPYYERPNFAFALIGTGSINFQARNRQYPKLVADAVGDAGAGAGYGHAFFDDSLLVGASVKFITRKSLDQEYTVLDIVTDDFKDMLDDDTVDGSGGLIDLGIIYVLRDFQVGEKDVDFRFGISASNLGKNDMGDARNIDDHIDLGFATNIGKLTFALDYVDITNQLGEDKDITKRIRIGAEYAVKPYL
ncbi:MAG: hypothetical protein JXM72_05900, partial [Deltaproteobacteria bacterium]|nr:hypothetical protein [Deltaproteobacteria bacterium]